MTTTLVTSSGPTRGWAAMSAPSGGASSAPQCACTNISIMQLFHELKQQYPGVPDHVVSSTISSHCHDRSACQSRLECEAKNYISHLYPSSSLSTAKKEGKDILLPQQCPNQLLITKESEKPKIVQVFSVCPQKAVCSFAEKLDENDNQNIVRDKHKECDLSQGKVFSQSCQSLEVGATGDTNFNNTDGIVNTGSENCKKDSKEFNAEDENLRNCRTCDSDNKSYRILKSNKVTSDLNKKLKDQDDKAVSDSALPTTDGKNEKTIETSTKLKRPTTLEFSSDPHFSGFDVKHKSGSLFPQTETVDESKRQTLSDKTNEAPGSDEPPKQYKYCDKSSETRNDSYGPHQDAYPLNVSVNLNCRMDVLPHGSRSQQGPFPEPWRGNYSSPGNYTSVNLTVCTPTSSVHGAPVDNRNPGTPYPGDARQRGFEGRVQITVSPASSQPPYRLPPNTQGRQYFSPLPQMMPETPPTSPIDALVRRQKARLARLQRALVAERGRLANMQREVSVLRGPAPAPASRLRPAVLRLRHLCQRLTRQLDRATSNADGEFYDNIYTGQRASHTPADDAGGTWQCHVCTFRNHGLLNKCEECDMPRIILGRAQHTGLLSVLPLAQSPTNREDHVESIIVAMDRQVINPDAKVHAS